MILTLLNVPPNVKYSDIKALVLARCGIQEIILDSLMPHENHTKKVTVGLADTEDAAIFMKEMDGYYWNGNRLQVIKKTKNQSSSNSNQQSYSGSTHNMQNFRAQVSNSGQKYRPEASNSGQNYRPQGLNTEQRYRPQESSSARGSKSVQNLQELSWPAQSFESPLLNSMNQNVPAMVPPPMNFDGYNYQPAFNQSAYYLMGQQAYATQTASSTQNMGYQYPGITCGNMGVWNQQQFGEIQATTQQGKEHDSNNERDSNQESDRWRGNREKAAWGDNQRSDRKDCRQDNRDFRERDDRNSRDYDSRGRHGHDSRGRNDHDSRGRNDHDSRGRNDHDSRGRNDCDSKGRNNRDSSWDNNRNSRNDNESRWENSGDSSRGNNSRRDNNLGTRWDRGQNSNQDSYRPNQGEPSHERSYRPDQAESSRNRDSYNRNEPKYTQPADYGDHSASFSHSRDAHKEEVSKWGPGNERNEGNRWGSHDTPIDRQRDRKPPPPTKRSRFSDFGDGEPPHKKIGLGIKKESQFQKPVPEKKFKQSPVKKEYQIPKGPFATPLEEKAHLQRLNLSTVMAKELLNDKKFEWEAPDRGALTALLKATIRRRIDSMLNDDYTIKMKRMMLMYRIKFHSDKPFSNYLLFRRVLKECGGRMITKMSPPAKKPPRTRPQKAERLAPGVFGNLKVDHRFEPKREKTVSLTAEQIPPPVQTQIGKTLYPPTKIPKPKIPTYPEGDRKLHIQQKKMAASLLNDDYIKTLLSAVSPAVAKAINEEVEQLIPVIERAFDDSTPIGVQFAAMGRTHTSTTMRRLLKINIARRILCVKPIVVRIFATPMVKRPPLEQFLNEYNVSTLKKSVKQPYYVASLETVEDHDRLCALQSTKIAGCQVSFKPFQFAGNKDKITEADIKRQRHEIESTQMRHSESLISHYNIENGFEPTKPKEYTDKGGNSEYEDDLQEMQEMCDEINKKQDFTTDIAENAGGQDIVEIQDQDKAGDLSCQEIEANISNVDLTNDDDDIDEMINNLNDNLDCLPVIEDRIGEVADDDDNEKEDNEKNNDEYADVDNEDINSADDINIADLNDDDLEDW